MFSRSRTDSARKPGSPGLSFIGAEAVVSGDINSDAHFHVDGRIDGHVRCSALCQGKTGIVAGNIHAEDARIAGLVEGAVFASNLTLEASARIKGDITYQTISIAAGAQVDGRLARRESLALPIEPGAESTPPILTALPIIEPIVPPRPPRKAAERSGKADAPEPPLADDIFTLTPPSQAGAH